MQTEYRQAIEQYRHKVLTLARYSLRSSVDADDVAQEVFIKLWRHWPSIDQEKRLAWLMRVTHNAVIDFVRRRKATQEHVDESIDADEISHDAQRLTTDGPQLNELDRVGLGSDLTRAIRQLEDPFRSILVMRDIQGLSYADIESSLEMNASQVKVYLHRARRKLRGNERLRQRFEEIE